MGNIKQKQRPEQAVAANIGVIFSYEWNIIPVREFPKRVLKLPFLPFI